MSLMRPSMESAADVALRGAGIDGAGVRRARRG